MKRIFLSICIVLLCSTLFTVSAGAYSVDLSDYTKVYYLTVPNVDFGVVPSDGFIAVGLKNGSNSSTVDVKVEVNPLLGSNAKTSDLFFNTKGSATLNIAGNLSAIAHADGFGDFDYVYDLGSGAGKRVNSFTFSVTSSGPLTYQDLIDNSTGGGSRVPSVFAAHLFLADKTGFVGTPVPPAILLLGSGLLGLVGLRRKNKGLMA
jgi:hypothetical protein